MLKGLKNKDKTKKDTTKDTKGKKETKEQKEVEEDVEKEENTDLVDADELKQNPTKVKQNTRKKNDYQLDQKQIDVSNINLVKNQPKKVMTTWVANSVDEVMKKDFEMGKIEHEFESLTDQQFNKKQKQKLLAKQKQQQNTPKIIQQNGIKLQTIEKTADQLKMEKAEQQMSFKIGGAQPSGIKIGQSTGPAIAFTNSGFSKQFAPIQKTAQQLKMQEMEKKQQQLAMKKPATSWIGTKKTNQATEEKPVFKQSRWAAMATQNLDKPEQNNIKYAPLNANEQKPTQIQTPKTNGWATSNIKQENGLKYAPLQISEQQRKMQGGRQQQEMVFLSKKQIQERKRKRQEKQKQLKAKQQPKV